MRHEYHIFKPGSNDDVAQVVRVAEALPHLTAGTCLQFDPPEGATADACWEIQFLEAQLKVAPTEITQDVCVVHVYTVARDREALRRRLPS